MQIDVLQTLSDLYASSGIAQFVANPLALVMVGIACLLMYLAIVKQFEPLLLLPIAFGMLLTNLLGAEVYHEELFAGGHANWSLFGGAILVDSKDLLNIGELTVNNAGAILNARVDRVVFGAYDENAGAVISRAQLFDGDFGVCPAVVGGYMLEECAAVLSDFFRKRRAET